MISTQVWFLEILEQFNLMLLWLLIIISYLYYNIKRRVSLPDFAEWDNKFLIISFFNNSSKTVGNINFH